MGRSNFGNVAGGIMSGMRDMIELNRADQEFGMRRDAYDRATRKADEEDAADKIVADEYAHLGQNAPSTVKTADNTLTYSNPEDAANAADALAFTGDAPTYTPGGKVSEYDVQNKIADRMAKANFGMRSQQWHQQADKLRSEGALAAYVGLREGYMSPEQASDYFNQYGDVRGVKVLDYDKQTGVSNVEIPDPQNPGQTKRIQYNLDAQIGRYLKPTEYADLKYKLAQADYAEKRPDLAYAAMAERARQADQANLTRMLLALQRGGGSGGSGSSSGSSRGGKGPAFETPMANAKAFFQVDDPAKYVADRNKGADGAAGDPWLADTTTSFMEQLMLGNAGASNVGAGTLYNIAKGMAQRARGVYFKGEVDDKNQVLDRKLFDAYRPYAELGQDGKWYSYVKDRSGNQYRIGNSATDPTQYGLSRDQVLSKEAGYLAPVLKEALASPENMQALEQRLGKQRASDLIGAYKAMSSGAPTPQATQAPAAPGQPFTAAELAVAKKHGVDPGWLSRNLSGAWDSVKSGVSGAMQRMDRNAFQNSLNIFRKTGDPRAANPTFMFAAIRQNPELAKLLTPDELTTLQVAVGQRL